MTTETETRAEPLRHEHPGRAVPGGNPDPEPTTAEFRAWRTQGRAWYQAQVKEHGAGSCYTFGVECPYHEGDCPFCGETVRGLARWYRWVGLYERKWGLGRAEVEKRLIGMQLRGEDPEWGLENCEREAWYWKGRMPLREGAESNG